MRVGVRRRVSVAIGVMIGVMRRLGTGVIERDPVRVEVRHHLDELFFRDFPKTALEVVDDIAAASHAL